MELDILIEDDRWQGVALPDIADAVVAALCADLALDLSSAEASLLACDDARIADLNGMFRDKPTATNVLSWPAEELFADIDGGPPRAPQAGPDGVITLGDMAIAWDTCAREAQAAGIPVANHVTHLVLHGMLHLLGFDHVRDADAARMEAAETRILGKMGLPDPYLQHGGG